MSEWLTDKEKRILFSALTREKSVCIQVDKQCEPREPYEQSLQSVCESLEHKFYYDRLFKQMEKQIRANAIDDFATDIINKINFEDKWLFDCKSNNADTNIAFSALRTFVNERAEQLKAGGKNESIQM